KKMSLLTLNKINEAVERRPAELEKARAEGKKVVGWLNYNVPAEKKYFRNEVKAYTEKLEKFAGKELKQEDLEKSIKLHNSIREAIKELYKLQAEQKIPISWREVYEVVQAGYYLDKEVYLNLLEKLIGEVNKSEPNVQISDDAPRILISGSILPPGDRKLIEILEEKGGRIVIDDLWSGYAPHFDLTIEESSLEAITDAYISRHTHASLPELEVNKDRRLKNISGMIKEFQVDGVLFHSLRYCDSFTFKATETKEVLKRKGIPFLEIHTEYAGSDYEAIRTRIEAYVEMLKARALNVV
ncbi:MAG: 2-hydroxyacyl-CoA dehydratase family protein, partial [Bacteroidota bacterium]|nr:2-hydroxyacyl-CoA dehydratase family protein [Bacteroidota bacterium]